MGGYVIEPAMPDQFIFCTLCSDTGTINSLAQQPCYRCCPLEYREWKEWRDQQRVLEEKVKKLKES